MQDGLKRRGYWEQLLKARAGKRLKLAATRASQADDGDVSEVSLALPRNDSEQDDETIDDTTFLKMMS